MPSSDACRDVRAATRQADGIRGKIANDAVVLEGFPVDLNRRDSQGLEVSTVRLLLWPTPRGSFPALLVCSI